MSSHPARIYPEFLNLWREVEKHGVDFNVIHGAFQSKVLGVALHAGILSPHGTADGLHDWWAAALEVTVWVRLLRALQETDSGPLPLEFWSSCEQDWEIQPYDLHDLKVLAERDEWLRGMLDQGYTTFLPHLGENDNGQIQFVNGLLTAARTSAERRAVERGRQVEAADVRAGVAQDHLYTPFLRQGLPRSTLTLGQANGIPSTLNVRVGALDWARYELALLYGSTNTRACASPSCNVVFIPSRRNQQFCGARCKEREKKIRQRKD